MGLATRRDNNNDNTGWNAMKVDKLHCLTENQYADWKEKNAAMKDDMRRGSVGVTTSNRDPGPR